MKQFFKFFFASCLGTLVALVVLFLILFSIAITSNPQTSIRGDSVLYLEFKNPIPEKTDNVRDEGFLYGAYEYIGLQRIVDLIDHAKSDPRIRFIVLRSEYPASGYATAQTIRKALDEFKESGKEVIAYGDFFSQTGYYLASVSDSVFLNPNGSIDLRGFSVITPHFKSMLDRLGIKMNVYYHGKYKSATESFRRESMSPESKYQYRVYLHDIKEDYFGTISESRNLPNGELDRIANYFASTNSDSAMTLNLADGLYYLSDFEDKLRKRLDLSEDGKIKYVTLSDYHNDVKIKSNNASDRIAVIHLEGEILYDQDENGIISYERYKSTLERIARSNSIKGVVLRVNSPGGVGFVADNLWDLLSEIKHSGKYLTVSMGDYAASGGYYISCMADTIIAESTSLTGSIGVYVMFPDVNRFMDDKLGIQFDSVVTNPYAISLSTLFPQGPEDDRIIQNITDEMYYKFLSRVADGRGLSMLAADEIAQGRIWSGKRAKEVGLVDEIGDLNDAIEITARALNLEEYRITEYPTIKTDIYREMLKAMNQNMVVRALIFSNDLQQVRKLNNYLKTVSQYKVPQARLPFFVE